MKVTKYTLTVASAFAAASSLSAFTMVNPGDLDSGVHTWTTAGSPYILNGTIFVKGGAELTIEPGVTVRGQGRDGVGVAGAPGSLIVTTDGYVNANGSAAQPIIFTTAALDQDQDGNPDKTSGNFDQFTGLTGADMFLDANPRTAPLGPLAADGTPSYQYWGGLVILGEAPTNLGANSSVAAGENVFSGITGQGHIEGLPKSSDTIYGGANVNDNSGVYRYISVRHGGEQLGSGNEINGITLGGVGAGTIFEYNEVYMNEDDGFEFFGGTVNTRYLISTYVGDDSFDGDHGWSGTNQYWLSVQSYLSVVGGDKGFEFDGDDGNTFDTAATDFDDNFINLSNYTVYNATIIGPQGATGNDESNGGINTKARFGGAIYNGYFVNTNAPVNGGINTTVGAVVAESTFSSPVASFVADTNTFLTSTGITAAGNVVNTTNTVRGADSAWVANSQALDPRPAFALSGIQNQLMEGTNVEATDFRGAFDPSTEVELWTKDWTALSIAGVLVD